MGEELREAVATGNESRVGEILLNCDVTILNSQNSVNGWTALHWACKRNYKSIVDMLVQKGADVTLKNNKSEIAADLTTDEAILALIGGKPSKMKEEVTVKEKPAIIPNYLTNPVFPYVRSDAVSVGNRIQPPLGQSAISQSSSGANISPQNRMSVPNLSRSSITPHNEILFRIRIANNKEDDYDYYEVEFPRDNLTYELLLTTMCQELNVDRSEVKKVRKVPNIVVRRDRDVMRLQNNESLELVLYN